MPHFAIYTTFLVSLHAVINIDFYSYWYRRLKRKQWNRKKFLYCGVKNPKRESEFELIEFLLFNLFDQLMWSELLNHRECNPNIRKNNRIFKYMLTELVNYLILLLYLNNMNDSSMIREIFNDLTNTSCMHGSTYVQVYIRVRACSIVYVCVHKTFYFRMF